LLVCLSFFDNSKWSLRGICTMIKNSAALFRCVIKRRGPFEHGSTTGCDPPTQLKKVFLMLFVTDSLNSGAVYENWVFDGLGINLGHITKMKERNATEFIDMATGARLMESTNGKQLIRSDYNQDDYDARLYLDYHF